MKINILWFSGGLILTYLLNIVFLSLVKRFPVFRTARVSQERWNNAWIPNVGGTAFMVVMWLVLIWLYGSGKTSEASFWVGAGAASFGYLHGLLDDHYTITPRLKLAGQAVCATLLWAGGVQIHYFDHTWADGLLTFFWIIGLMNSINMLDNMDGITGGVALSILGVCGLFLYGYGLADAPIFTVLMVLAGGLTGFLILNVHPARLFMGDKGSQFWGVWLAYLGIEYFWNTHSATNFHWFRSGMVPILIFLIPIMDTTFVTVLRLWQGKSPAQGGRDHTTHHWAYLGISQKGIALGYFMISLFAGFMAYEAVFEINNWHWIHTAMYLTFIFTVVVIFVAGYRLGERRKECKASPKQDQDQDQVADEEAQTESVLAAVTVTGREPN